MAEAISFLCCSIWTSWIFSSSSTAILSSSARPGQLPELLQEFQLVRVEPIGVESRLLPDWLVRGRAVPRRVPLDRLGPERSVGDGVGPQEGYHALFRA